SRHDLLGCAVAALVPGDRAGLLPAGPGQLPPPMRSMRSMRSMRTARYLVDDLAEAVAVATRHSSVMVLDLENTLVGYGSSLEARGAAMPEARARVASAGHCHRVVFASNSRFELPAVAHEALSVSAVTAARKPHVRLPPLRRLRAELQGAAVF